MQKTEQDGIAGIMIGFKADNVIGGPDWFELEMGMTLTGGYSYPTGYLFETLRGKGLVYVVQSQNSAGRSKDLPGAFLVFAGCDPGKVNEVVDLCLLNIARLQGTENDINATWYNRAKELIAVADAMDHETPAAQATTAALDELFGLGYAWHDQFADKIKAIPMPAVQALARERLKECVVTISTPAPDLVKVKPGRRTYESFPPVDLTPRGVQHDTGTGGKWAYRRTNDVRPERHPPAIPRRRRRTATHAGGREHFGALRRAVGGDGRNGRQLQPGQEGSGCLRRGTAAGAASPA